MTRAEDIIESILANRREQTARVSMTGVYKDEPLLKTGAQLIREQRQKEEKPRHLQPASGRFDAKMADEQRPSSARGKARRYSKNAQTRPSADETCASPVRTRRMQQLPLPEVPHIESAPNPDRSAVRNADSEPAARFGKTMRRPLPIARRRSLDHVERTREAEEALLASGFADSLRPAPPASPAHKLPDTLARLRDLECDDAFARASRERLFVAQARLAADYEDDFPFSGDFHHYFPTYRAMDDYQLRGYFAWRTCIRRGSLVRGPLSFAFVHLYELINGISVTDPSDGFAKLSGFWQSYRQIDRGIDRYCRIWVHDYVVYHGLSASLLDHPLLSRKRGGAADAGDAGGPSPSSDEALMVLRQADDEASTARVGRKERRAPAYAAGNEKLFSALARASSYRIESSKLSHARPKLLRDAACELWRALASYYRKNRKKSLFEHLFGSHVARYYPMFRSAVFFGESRHADAVFDEGPLRRFVCRGGMWTVEGYDDAEVPNAELGRWLKELDRSLREAIGFSPALKAPIVPKYVKAGASEAIAVALECEREAERRRIDIDFSKLAGIRQAANVTCEALLTDEERDEAPESRPAPAPPEHTEAAGQRPERSPSANPSPHSAETRADVSAPASTPASSSARARNPYGLTDSELAWLRAVASGDADARRKAANEAGSPETLLVDRVNEKLFELVGDIAIEDAQNGPALIEDYEPDVRGMLQ